MNKLIRIIDRLLAFILRFFMKDKPISIQEVSKNPFHPNSTPFIMAYDDPFYNLECIFASPIFIPRKHTKESYRSQQRRAKQRRKSKNRP
jgi:lysophospholipid acyltransferase (LPLAT)-like uncharacterized protein